MYLDVYLHLYLYVYLHLYLYIYLHLYLCVYFAFVFVLIAGGWWDLAGGSLAVGNRCLLVHQRPLLPSEMKSSGLDRPSQTLAGKLFGKLSAGLKRDVSAEISRQRCCR